MSDTSEATAHPSVQEQAQLERINQLINRSPMVVIEWFNRPGWPVRFVSDTVRRWGYQPDELRQGRVLYSDLIHPDDAARIHAEVENYLAHGPDSYRQKYRLRCADGRWIWIDDHTTLERDPAGHVTVISGVLLDVTDQMAVESERDLLAAMADHAGDALILTVGGKFRDCNRAALRLFGCSSREDLLGRSPSEFSPPRQPDGRSSEEASRTWLHAAMDGTTQRFEWVHQRLDGSLFDAEVALVQFRLPTGEGAIIGIVRDIAERKAAEEALRRSQSFLHRAQEIARMGSWSQDLVGGLFSWSPQTYAIHEVTPSSVVLTIDAILAMLHPEDVDRLRTTYAQCVERGEPFDIRYRLLMPDGRVKHLHVKGEFEFESGVPVRSVGMVADETELREIRRDRDRLTAVLENTTDIVSMADPQGRVFYFNRAGYEVLGLDPGQPLDDVIRHVHPPWAAQLVHDQGIPTAIREGRWLGETAVIGANGQELPMSQLIMVHRDEQGQVEFLWTILRDISERKAVEAALELERTQMAQAQAVAHVGSWTLLPADNRLIWSDEHYRVLGYEPRSVEPSLDAFFAAVHPDDRAMVRAYLERDLQATAPGVSRFDHRIVTAQGVRHVEERANVQLDEQGQLVRIIGTTMDITERVVAGEALRRSEQRYLLAARIGRSAAWEMWPQEGKAFSDANLAWLLGYELEELGENLAAWMKTIPEEARAAVAEAMQPVIDGRADTYQVEHPVLRKDGSRGWVRVRGQRVTPPGEVPLRIVGSSLDITDAVHAAEQLRHANQVLEQRVAERTAQLLQANQELEAFSYTVSHDLKAPLRGIDGYSQLLMEDYAERLDEDGRQFVQRIRDGVRIMGDLIGDLLEYSRMERRDMSHDPVAVQPLVQQVLAGYEADIRQQGVCVDVSLPPVTLVLDPEGMAVVLRNLVGNAIKFSRDSHPPRITIGGERLEGRYRLWVRDNGIGFDMKYHDRVFAMFQRLHRAEDFSGTGVGLALVAKAVQRMDGRVWAQSAPGEGATFYLEFSA
jgi:PAS domain S-box-containing protein